MSAPSSELLARFEVVESFPGWNEYFIGEKVGRIELRIRVAPSMQDGGPVEGKRWDIGCNSFTLQPPVRDLAKALALAAHLYDGLYEEAVYESARRDEQFAADEARRAAERPAREAAERKRARAVANAPRVAVQKCTECGHLDEPFAFDQPGYECSRCGSGGVGEDGRRCDQCHIFRARVADYGCPSCEAPLDSEPAQVLAADLGRDGLVEVES